eukprot:6176761-Amphidinium_carterae.1
MELQCELYLTRDSESPHSNYTLAKASIEIIKKVIATTLGHALCTVTSKKQSIGTEVTRKKRLCQYVCACSHVMADCSLCEFTPRPHHLHQASPIGFQTGPTILRYGVSKFERLSTSASEGLGKMYTVTTATSFTKMSSMSTNPSRKDFASVATAHRKNIVRRDSQPLPQHTKVTKEEIAPFQGLAGISA